MTPHDRDDVLLEYVKNLRDDVVEARDGIKETNAHILDLLQRTTRIEERQQILKDTPARWAGGVAILGMIWSLLHNGAVK